MPHAQFNERDQTENKMLIEFNKAYLTTPVLAQLLCNTVVLTRLRVQVSWRKWDFEQFHKTVMVFVEYKA